MKLLNELITICEKAIKITPEIAAAVYHRDYIKTKKQRQKRYLQKVKGKK